MIGIPKLLLLWAIVCILLFAIPAIFVPHRIKGFLDEFLKNAAFGRAFGSVVLIFAFLFLMVHIAFDGTRYMIFSFIGLISLLKGIRMVRFPSSGIKAAKAIYGKKMGAMMIGILLIILCLFLLRITLTKLG